jgi:hypothetical protein
MVFESKLKRTWWVNLFLAFIPDLLIAIVLAAIFEGGLIGFIGAFIGLQFLYLLIWIKTSVWTWLFFSLRGRKKMAAFLRDYLYEHQYPPPRANHSSVEEYFDNVVRDANQPEVLRLRAAGDLAAFKYPATQGELQQFARLSMAYEDAFEQHRRYFVFDAERRLSLD